MPQNGDLVAAGLFSVAGSVVADGIAQWDGQNWIPLGAGLTNATGFASVEDIVALPNGELLASGSFSQAGTVAANRLARWDGQSWSAMGGGTDTSAVAFGPVSNGNVYIGGNFSSAGGAPAGGFALWDGTAVAPIGAGTNGLIADVVSWPGGDEESSCR